MRTRTLLGVLAALLLAAQLVGVDRTNPPVTSDVPAPEDVKSILRRACYDCHSHETVWPWYSAVAPTSWLVAHDVHEGRDELNLSTWDAYGPAKRSKLVREIVEQVADGEMPPWPYLLVHGDARLSSSDVERLRAWAADLAGRR